MQISKCKCLIQKNVLAKLFILYTEKYNTLAQGTLLSENVKLQIVLVEGGLGDFCLFTNKDASLKKVVYCVIVITLSKKKEH